MISAGPLRLMARWNDAGSWRASKGAAIKVVNEPTMSSRKFNIETSMTEWSNFVRIAVWRE
jgi:hypothetical protein